MSPVNLISVLAIPSSRLLIKLLNITRAITDSLGILLSLFFKFHSKHLITVLFVQLYNQLFAHLIGILWGKYCRQYQKNCKNEVICRLLHLTCNSYFFTLWKKIARVWIVLEKGKLVAVHSPGQLWNDQKVWLFFCNHRHNKINQNIFILNIFL